jgi:hypothetical protein
MVWFSQYSAHWESHTAYFLLVSGVTLTWTNAIFNLSTTASMTYDWLFLEPFLFLGFLYAEIQGHITCCQAKQLYIGFFIYVSVRYVAFLYNLISQLTTGLNIPFITVQYKKKDEPKELKKVR